MKRIILSLLLIVSLTMVFAACTSSDKWPLDDYENEDEHIDRRVNPGIH